MPKAITFEEKSGSVCLLTTAGGLGRKPQNNLITNSGPLAKTEAQEYLREDDKVYG
jgi:hypothetical protein